MGATARTRATNEDMHEETHTLMFRRGLEPSKAINSSKNDDFNVVYALYRGQHHPTVFDSVKASVFESTFDSTIHLNAD